MLGLACALKAEGHAVVFASNDKFASLANEAGLDFQPLGARADYDAAYAVGDYEDGTPAKNERLSSLYFNRLVEPLYRWIASERRAHPSGLQLVCPPGRHSTEVIAATQFGIPVTRVILAPSQLPGAVPWPYNCLTKFQRRCVYAPLRWVARLQSPYRRRQAQWEKKLGTGTHVASWFVRNRTPGLGTLALFPEWFLDEPYPDLSEGRECQPVRPTCVGFPLHDPPTHEHNPRLEEWLGSDSEAPIVFTSGTGSKDVDSFYRVSRDACRALGARAVFVNRDQERLRELASDRVFVLEYADFARLLPRTRLIVHHGGIGTCAQALQARIPQVIRPLEYDQPDNGWRVAQLGLGGMILRDDYTVDGAARYLSQILTNDVIASRVAAYAQRHTPDALRQAAKFITSGPT